MHNVLFTLFVLAVMFCLYFLPSFVARKKQKKNTGSIFVLNLFLGWTLVGWVIALAWAMANE